MYVCVVYYTRWKATGWYIFQQQQQQQQQCSSGGSPPKRCRSLAERMHAP